jgi:hypothetical protein
MYLKSNCVASERAISSRVPASPGRSSAQKVTFATQVGRERLINISVAASGGTDAFGIGGTGVIVVWFWE